jgi:hypothetical protein
MTVKVNTAGRKGPAATANSEVTTIGRAVATAAG